MAEASSSKVDALLYSLSVLPASDSVIRELRAKQRMTIARDAINAMPDSPMHIRAPTLAREWQLGGAKSIIDQTAPVNTTPQQQPTVTKSVNSLRSQLLGARGSDESNRLAATQDNTSIHKKKPAEEKAVVTHYPTAPDIACEWRLGGGAGSRIGLPKSPRRTPPRAFKEVKRTPSRDFKEVTPTVLP